MSESKSDHRVPLPGTRWGVWREALVRSAGFPASGLHRFAAPDCAASADALLAGTGTDAAFDEALDAARAAASAEVARIAGDPLFREAVTWQNPAGLVALDGLATPGPRNSRRRQREELVARYWQRYCGKNETVGFFGPAVWAPIDPDSAEALQIRPGAGLVRGRTVRFEDWAMQAYADALAEDPAVRPWLPLSVPPHLTLDGRLVRRPAKPPVSLTPAELAALRLCDGQRSATEVVAALRADPTATGPARDADAVLLLDRLAERGLLVWGVAVPLRPDAEALLRARLAAITDPAARQVALAGLDELGTARGRVAAAAGDPIALRAALADLDEVFATATGRSPRRRAGQMYAGRALVYEDAVRDVEVVFGRPVLDAIAAPLALLLHAARWLTGSLAAAYGAELRDLYDELRADGRDAGPVRLADLWYLAQGALFGGGDRPVDRVAAEFAARWKGILDLPAGERRVTYRAADLAERVAAAFPAERPGWAGARIHSPDLHLLVAAGGEVTAVLGELHAAWPTFDCALFTGSHPEPARLRAAFAADVGPYVRPLYPAGWPRYTGRLAYDLDGPADPQLAFTAAPGADPARVLPATAVSIVDDDATLVAVAPDGRRWPVLECFAALLAMHAVDAFKLLSTAPHTPRITVDRLVVTREAWRTTVGATGLARPTGDRARFLAVRAWRRALGLPDEVYVKVGTETKPCYVDLTSPLYASVLCTLLRGAAAGPDGDGVTVTVSEVLPAAGDAWLTDAAGRRYHSELRLQVVDPCGVEEGGVGEGSDGDSG